MDIARLSEISIAEAIQDHEAGEWHEAIATELESIIKNETLTLIDRPKGESIIGSRVVLRNKRHENGTLERRKNRRQKLLATTGIDFEKTCSCCLHGIHSDLNGDCS